MKEFSFQQIPIKDEFWDSRLKMNADEAIYYQWEQLEKTRNIDNFRIMAGKKDGFRWGFFYCDSDSYKWLDAASRVYAKNKSEKLKKIMDEYIELISETQKDDGYIYTYNQFHFPEVRWKNLQIEHELYSLGHLIEAGVYHKDATGQDKLLRIAEKSADRVYEDFINKGAKLTPGHQEIEIALIKLYRATQNEHYLDLAKYFIMERGKISAFFPHFLGNALSQAFRASKINKVKKKYLVSHPEDADFSIPEHVETKMPRGIIARAFHLFASGKYNQQHKPVLMQNVPEGHAVRFTYQSAAAAMLCREIPNPELLKTLSEAWDIMVQKRMFVTGGIGAIPLIEGFGYDYELNPFYAYCETCAALGCMFWNWEMTLLTKDAKYADLFEWQLYNSASCGIALDGKSYLYRNPLASNEDLIRRDWYGTPCCPSNVSRTWAILGQYIYSYEDDALWIHQYVGNSMSISPEAKENEEEKIDVTLSDSPISIEMHSGLPWSGDVKIKFSAVKDKDSPYKLYLRIPGWSRKFTLKINDIEQEIDLAEEGNKDLTTASGFNPYSAFYYEIERNWTVGDIIDINFPMDIHIHEPDSRVKACRNQFAISRGPIVYAIENVDNPDIEIFDSNIDMNSFVEKFNENILGGTWTLIGDTKEGRKITLIPYYMWENRGKSKMSVMLNK